MSESSIREVPSGKESIPEHHNPLFDAAYEIVKGAALGFPRQRSDSTGLNIGGLPGSGQSKDANHLQIGGTLKADHQ